MMPSKKKSSKTQPKLAEPVTITLQVTEWRHLARVLVYSNKAAPGMRHAIVVLAAEITKACTGLAESAPWQITNDRSAWCGLTHSLSVTGLCPIIAQQIIEQIPV